MADPGKVFLGNLPGSHIMHEDDLQDALIIMLEPYGMHQASAEKG